MGPITRRMARLDPGPSQSFGLLGAAFAAAGALLLILALTAVNWFTTAGLGSTHAGDLKKILQSGTGAVGIAKAYFAWLGWALVVAVVVLAILANLPWPLARIFRVIGAIVAALGIALTFLAIRLTSTTGANSPTYGDYLDHARMGFYLAIAGFLLVGIGCVIGPSRTRR